MFDVMILKFCIREMIDDPRIIFLDPNKINNSSLALFFSKSMTS